MFYIVVLVTRTINDICLEYIGTIPSKAQLSCQRGDRIYYTGLLQKK
jgi:hypothetical protein